MRPEITIYCIQCDSAMKREPYIHEDRRIHFTCSGQGSTPSHEKWNYAINVKEFNYAMSMMGTK